MPLPRVRRTRRGFELRLQGEERAVLRQLAAELRELLGTEDPGLARLYPPGHAEDPEVARQYAEMVRGDLTAQRLAALATVEATVDGSTRLDREQLEAWLSVLNDLRLVLGTRLDVTEEMTEEEFAADDPRAPAYAVYRFLTWLEWQVVEVLAEDLGSG